MTDPIEQLNNIDASIEALRGRRGEIVRNMLDDMPITTEALEAILRDLNA
jgi:hypothetical protein